jgi:hypothetical protein
MTTMVTKRPSLTWVLSQSCYFERFGVCKSLNFREPIFGFYSLKSKFATEPFYTVYANAYRLTNKPMTMSCICVDLEKQIVLRTKRLIRVRNVRCLRSIFCVFRLPGL